MPAIRSARSRKPPASSFPAAASWCSTCASTRRTWVRDRLGDRWLGFTDERLRALLDGAGLTDIEVGVGARERAMRLRC